MAKSSKKTAAAKADGKESKDPKAAPAVNTASKKAVAKKAASKKAVKKAASKKTAVKKTVAKKAVAKKAAVRKKATAAAKTITAQMRHELIAQAAYLRSESQGFLGDAEADWMAAEAEVDERLAKGGVKVRG
jgi:hypothetical protein